MNRTTKKLVEAIAPSLVYRYLRLLRLTTRLDCHNRSVMERVRRSDGQCIFAFWHSRLVIMPFVHTGEPLVVLQSRHRDSRMLGRVLERFGIEQAWGSSTRGGAAALRDVLRKIRQGYDLAIAPDGPRGPRRRAQVGVITAGRLSGKPIVPLSCSARPATRVNSWDRLLVPWLFSRAVFEFGEPIRVPRAADADEEERLRLHLETELDRLTDTADRGMGLAEEEPRPPVEGT